MGTRPHSSAAGVLALLADPEPLLKQHALKSLVPLVPQFWAEISEHIALMSVPKHSPIAIVSHNSSLTNRESLYESTELPKEARDFAALLASKVYYFLGEYDESLSFALGAGKAFEEETFKQGLEEYVETIVCQ